MTEALSLRDDSVPSGLVVVRLGARTMDDGFPLLPTLDAPHWTVVLASATASQFSRVRTHFEGPIANPSYRPRSR